MPEKVSSRLDRWFTPLVAFCAVGTIVCFVGLGYLQTRVSKTAMDGQRARVQQCVSREIVAKEQRDFHARGRISWAELQTILGALPTREECVDLLAAGK